MVGEGTITGATSDGISTTMDVISVGTIKTEGGETTILIPTGLTGRHIMVTGVTHRATDTITRTIETIRIGDIAAEWTGIDGGDIIDIIAGMTTIRIISDQGRSKRAAFSFDPEFRRHLIINC